MIPARYIVRQPLKHATPSQSAKKKYFKKLKKKLMSLFKGPSRTINTPQQMTTIQNTADATADSLRIMSRLAALRPAAATASAATVRLSEVAEAELAKKSSNKTPALNATLDTIKEYHIAADAGNEANDIAQHVSDVYGGYSNAVATYNAAALVANMAMAAAVEKRGIAEAKVADCNSGGLFEHTLEGRDATMIRVESAAQVDQLRDTEKAVADANEATIKANEAMEAASEATAAKDKWAEIIACYDLDAIEALTQAIRADARTACSTPTVARFDPKLKAAAV